MLISTQNIEISKNSSEMQLILKKISAHHTKSEDKSKLILITYYLIFITTFIV